MNLLDFEAPILELEKKIKQLETSDSGIDVSSEIQLLKEKVYLALRNVYNNLEPWQKTQVARHEDRPHFLNYLPILIDNFIPLAGDRTFGEDHALLGGMGYFDKQPVMILGHEKGHDSSTRMHHNFGLAKPEGYRKAQRLMRLAEKFFIPVLTFIDTAGAYPGIEAEERGQAEAIARSIQTCLDIQTPLIAVIIGEGGSGGALAIATANQVFMLEHSIYSIISPEGCASILWRNGQEAKTAASALKLTAQDLKTFKIIDDIIPEPLGGAHRNHQETILNVKQVLIKALESLKTLSPKELKIHRQQRFINIGRNLI